MSNSAYHHHQKKEAMAAPTGRVEGCYADFVTAMMALFIVLWLLSSSKRSRRQSADISEILPARRRKPINHAARREFHSHSR